MLARLLDVSLSHRALVLSAILAMAVAGVWSFKLLRQRGDAA